MTILNNCSQCEGPSTRNSVDSPPECSKFPYGLLRPNKTLTILVMLDSFIQMWYFIHKNIVIKKCFLQTTLKSCFFYRRKGPQNLIPLRFCYKDWKVTDSAWREHAIWSPKYVDTTYKTMCIRVIRSSLNKVMFSECGSVQPALLRIKLYKVKLVECMF